LDFSRGNLPGYLGITARQIHAVAGDPGHFGYS